MLELVLVAPSSAQSLHPNGSCLHELITEHGPHLFNVESVCYGPGVRPWNGALGRMALSAGVALMYTIFSLEPHYVGA
jgi:hypothetical protein